MTDHKQKRMMPFFIATTNSYFSKGAAKKVIDITTVNMFRPFAFGVGREDENVDSRKSA